MQGTEGTRLFTALVLGLDLQGVSVLLLAPLNLLPFFFSFLLFSTPPFPPKCSLEQGLQTRGHPWRVSLLPGCGIAHVVSDPVNICVQSRKSLRGRLEDVLVRGVMLRLGVSFLGNTRESWSPCAVFLNR